MIRRTVAPTSVYATTKIRPRADRPMITNRCSPQEWSASGNATDPRSSKTVAASRKSTRCFLRFLAAFRGSHVNVTGPVYRDSLIRRSVCPTSIEVDRRAPTRPIRKARGSKHHRQVPQRAEFSTPQGDARDLGWPSPHEWLRRRQPTVAARRRTSRRTGPGATTSGVGPKSVRSTYGNSARYDVPT